MSALSVGMQVTTTFVRGEEAVVRTLVSLERDAKRYGSGFKASADGGERCPTCGKLAGTPIGPIDSAWFSAVPR